MNQINLFGETQGDTGSGSSHCYRAIGGHESPNRGKTDEWITPKEIIDAVGPFDLDPCSNDVQPWPCAKTLWTFEDSGLMNQWFGRVWLNPPYGPEAGKWLEKLANHGNGIALIFARTETAFFHRTIWQKADAILFFKGRLHFYRPDGTKADGNAGAPSVLIAFGEDNVKRLQESGIKGAIVHKWDLSR